MDLKVSVRETSRITQSDGDVTELSSLSPGCLRELGDKLILTYTDTTEGGRVFNRVEIEDECVSVKRSGAVSLSLRLKVGEVEKTVYEVPPFAFDMTVKTESVRVVREQKGGLRIGLRFDSIIGGAPQKTELVIRALPKGDGV